MLKLDMAKANDHMDWEFIYAILEAFGFDQLWIDGSNGVSRIVIFQYF